MPNIALNTTKKTFLQKSHCFLAIYLNLMPLFGKYCDVALKRNGLKGNLSLENATSALTGGSFDKKNENEKRFHAKRKKVNVAFSSKWQKRQWLFFVNRLKKEYINT